MRKTGSIEQHGGPQQATGVQAAGESRGGVSTATREDLARAVRALADAEALKAEAVAALLRVRARGDGEAAVGMPVEQHLRWATNLRRGTVSTLSVIVDVAEDLPTVMAAHAAGAVNLDQVAAVAWPAARVSRDLRRALDLSLSEADDWTRLSPDALESEVARLLEDLTPALTEAAELERAQRQYLHLQPTLDGQGLKLWGQAWGLDAAVLDATLRAAADTPEATEPDPDGVLVGQPTARDGQLFTGLMRICNAFTGRTAGGADDADAEATPRPAVTIHAIVDERADATGSGELLTARRGLAPRLTAAAVRDLQADGARRVEVVATDGELVAVRGRTGHTVTDPAGLSADTTRILVRVRDRTCRMAGCDRPVEHLHHLVHRGHPDSTDDPSNLAGLCLRCHQHVVHRWRWTGTVGALGRITWHRPDTGLATAPDRARPAGPHRPNPANATTMTTVGRLAQRLPRPPRPPPDSSLVDQLGEPLPY